MIIGVAGGVEGKRRLRKAAAGKARAVQVVTVRKKKSQRGATVGRVKTTTKNNPPQPRNERISAAGMNSLTGGEESGSISHDTDC
jgi:hypothetical protein